MTKTTDRSTSRPPRQRTRLWSLPASRAAHGAPDEIEGIERTLHHSSWLLLALILVYVLFNSRALTTSALNMVWGGALAYTTALLALRSWPESPAPSRWPMLVRCWLMIAFITGVLWALRVDTGALVTLYHLVVIASAVSLNRRLTLVNLSIIGACLIVLAHPARLEQPLESTLALTLFAQIGPMLLVAYVTSRVAGDIRNALERIRFISETDELTRLFNLRAFMQVAERLHRQAKRYNRPYSLVMIDSDNLKTVNDTHGHQCGNDLLKLTTGSIRRELRDTDVAARYGGDEFIVLLPETGADGARELSERIRRSVEIKALEVRGQRVRTTVSIGVASFPAHGADLHSILNKADQAMYLAKRTGRNRVVVFDPG